MRCDSCGVTVDPAHAVCPLCRRNTAGGSKTAGNRWYPSYSAMPEPRESGTFARSLIFMIMAVISITLVINVLGSRDVWWSLFVAPCVLYAWLLIRHTWMSNSHLGAKIVVQWLGLSGMLLWINALSGGTAWSTGYVIPFLVMAATLLMTLLCIAKPLGWREFGGYLLLMVFLGFTPLLFFLLGLSHVLWPSVSAAMYALLTFGGMWLLADKGFRKEVKRRLHY
ncbi:MULTISPECIES: DUF6320 domain-containing protein [Paenibacillus]|jgi:hypothetical protein|uniref:DUF6320 domain-containing protein n=1 Tax=Paenibacillus TaxID=44249 RepID=UPI00048DE892|nr:DUF6320 domain-containing protein [Paenibacillus sp. IHBB 10380]